MRQHPRSRAGAAGGGFIGAVRRRERIKLYADIINNLLQPSNDILQPINNFMKIQVIICNNPIHKNIKNQYPHLPAFYKHKSQYTKILKSIQNHLPAFFKHKISHYNKCQFR